MTIGFMPVERSAGIIFFLKTPQGRKYLIIRSSGLKKKRKEFWDFPKGKLEKGETGLQAATREAQEETGIDDFEIDPNFKETVRYFTWREGQRMPKFVAMFLVEAKTDKVKLSWEHDAYEWLPYEEAYKKLSTMKKALKKAYDHLQAKNI